MTDPLDLERFVTAQEPVFDKVLNELRAGWKRTHWMWFVFPRLRGLSRSSMAEYYGISSLAEARALSGAPGAWAAARSLHSNCPGHRSAIAQCDFRLA